MVLMDLFFSVGVISIHAHVYKFYLGLFKKNFLKVISSLRLSVLGKDSD